MSMFSTHEKKLGALLLLPAWDAFLSRDSREWLEEQARNEREWLGDQARNERRSRGARFPRYQTMTFPKQWKHTAQEGCGN